MLTALRGHVSRVRFGEHGSPRHVYPLNFKTTLDQMQRCLWAQSDLMIAYHDQEWGVPVHDDRCLFEFLILEGAQAGLCWQTILKKRSTYRSAFWTTSTPKKSLRYGRARDQARLLGDPRRYRAQPAEDRLGNSQCPGNA